MNMGNVLSSKGRYGEALGHYQSVLRFDPRHTLAYCNLGNAQFALGKYEEAAVSFKTAIDLNPGFILAHYNLGNLRGRQKRFDEAKSAYKDALKLSPGFVEAWHNLGIVLSRLECTDEAEGAYREALRLNPGYAQAHNNLGLLLQQQGRWTEAENAYREALRLMPNFYDARNNLGNVLINLERIEEAVQCFETTLANSPHAFAHFNLGNIYTRQKRFDEAIEHLRQAVAFNPERAEFQNNLGNTLRQAGEYKESEAALREAIRLNPNDASAYFNLGLLLTTKGGSRQEALSSYRRAIELSPANEPAIVGEVSILEKEGEIKQAYERLAPLLELGKLSVGVALVFASLCRPLKRCDEAIVMLQRLLDGEGPHLETIDRIPLHFSLGSLLDSAGEYDKAFENFSQGNNLELAGQHFDLQVHVKRNEDIMATYNKNFMARAPHASQSSERPIFIVGMPRSGTSLVEQILASHPAVFGAGELHEMHRIVADLSARALYPRCVESLTSEQCTELAQCYLDYIDNIAGSDAQRVTDKMPSNYLHLGLITMLFPHARIIHCVRDPLDTCLSCYFQDFDDRLLYTNDLGILGAYYAEYRRLMAHWRSVLESPWLEISYEDLIADQEGISRALVEYCGLDWDERCLRFHETQRYVSTASYDQVRQPLYSRSVGRWRHYDKHLGPLRRALAQHSTHQE